MLIHIFKRDQILESSANKIKMGMKENHCKEKKVHICFKSMNGLYHNYI